MGGWEQRGGRGDDQDGSRSADGEDAPSHALARLHPDPRVALALYRRIQRKQTARRLAIGPPAADGEPPPIPQAPNIRFGVGDAPLTPEAAERHADAVGEPAAAALHGPAPAEKLDVGIATLSKSGKLLAAIERSGKYLGPEAAAKIASFLTPGALEMLTMVMVGGAVLQAIPIVGEVADVGLAGWAVYSLGGEAIHASKEIFGFVKGAVAAKSASDLDAAGHHFAKLVAMVGVDAAIAFMLHRTSKDISAEVNRSAKAMSEGGPTGLAPATVGARASAAPAATAGYRVLADGTIVELGGAAAGATFAMSSTGSGGQDAAPKAEGQRARPAPGASVPERVQALRDSGRIRDCPSANQKYSGRFEEMAARAAANDIGEQGLLEFLERKVFVEKKHVDLIEEVQNRVDPRTGKPQTNPDARVDGELVEVKTRAEPFVAQLNRPEEVAGGCVEDWLSKASDQIKQHGTAETGALEGQLIGRAARDATPEVQRAMSAAIRRLLSRAQGTGKAGLHRVSVFKEGALWIEFIRTPRREIVQTK